MKIVCATCSNEKERRCTVKKNQGIHPNKRRNCALYILASEKIKMKQVLDSVYIPYEQREEFKKMYKQEEKKRKEALKEQRKTGIDVVHPMTGDLSRFRSTANR